MRQKNFLAFAPINAGTGLASPSRYTECTEVDAMQTWSGKARRRPRRRPAARTWSRARTWHAARSRPAARSGRQLILPLAVPMALGLALGIVVAESGGTTTKLAVAPAAASAAPAGASATPAGASATPAATQNASANADCELIVP